MTENVQPNLSYQEWLATEYRPIRGGSPEGDAAAGEPGDIGQGVEGADQGLYDLETVPENLRQQIEPHLKAMERNATRKFQEAADYRKQWEPYEELGLVDQDPQRVAALMELGEILDDPQTAQQWWQQVGEELGYFGDGEGAGEGDGLEEPLTAEQVKQLLAEQLEQQMQPLNERISQQEQERLVSEAHDKIASDLAAIKEENADADTDAIVQLALAYEDEDDPIAKGYEDYKRLTSKGEANLFDKKAKQPKPAEAGGPAAGPEAPTDWDTAQENALERFKSLTS